MRIGVDARPLGHTRGGIYRMASHLLQNLSQLDRSNDYFLYSRSDFNFPLDNPRWKKRLHRWVASRPSTIWFHTGVKETIALDAVDVFWGTVGVFPLGLPASMFKVLTVYDMVWYFYPETMSPATYRMHRLFAKRSIRSADKIITISESTARDLCERLGVPRNKICVVYPGVDCSFEPTERTTAAREIARKYGTSEDYICTVGTIEPRKNVVTLIEAMKVLRDVHHFPYQLLIAGATGWKDSEIYEWPEKRGLTQADVKFLGHVAEEDLPLFYSGAHVFVFPSLYEGFGIPLIEGMSCGVPIVASNALPIPEIVQEAAVLVSPRAPEGFAEAILRVTEDQALRQSLVEKGLRRASMFRWGSAAEKVLGVLRGC
jgi:glycosyltransferase involved in cell wall biosynthesis